MAAEFKEYIRRLQIAPNIKDCEPELDDKDEVKDLELRWGSCRLDTSESHSACAHVLYADTSNGLRLPGSLSGNGLLAACSEQQDLNRGIVMRSSIVPG